MLNSTSSPSEGCTLLWDPSNNLGVEDFHGTVISFADDYTADGTTFFWAITSPGTGSVTGHTRRLGASNFQSATVSFVAFASGAVFLGGDTGGSWANARYWNVRVYARQLSVRDVAIESISSSPLASGLWAWWPLDGNLQGILVDRSGNNRHLTRAGSGRIEPWFLSGAELSPLPRKSAVKAPAAGGTTVTPTTAALTTTRFAPTVTVTAHQTVTPTTKALTLTTFAPTVTASDHKLVTPTTKALSTTTFAPTVTVADNKLATPTTAELVLSSFAPTVTITANQTVTPTTAALTLTKFAPTVSATNHKTVTPGTASLTLTAFAPTVALSGAVEVVPSPAALTLTTFVPTVDVTVYQPVQQARRAGGAGFWLPSERDERDMLLRAQQIREDEELLVIITAALPIIMQENNNGR